jgi:hypothetical protein
MQSYIRRMNYNKFNRAKDRYSNVDELEKKGEYVFIEFNVPRCQMCLCNNESYYFYDLLPEGTFALLRRATSSKILRTNGA